MEKKQQLRLYYLQFSYLYVTFVVSCFSSPEGLAVLYNTRGRGGVGFLVPANLNNFHPSAHKSLNQELAKEIVYRQVVRESSSLDSVWDLKIQFYLYYAHGIGQNILNKMKVWEIFSAIYKRPFSNCYRGNQAFISLSPPSRSPRHLGDFIFARNSHCNYV